MTAPAVGTRVRRVTVADLIGGKVLVPAGALGRVIEPEYPRGVSVRWDVQHDAAGQIIHAGDMDVFERTCEVLK